MTLEQIRRNYPIDEQDPALLGWAESAARAIFAHYGGYAGLADVLRFLRTVVNQPARYLTTHRQQLVIAILADMVGES